MSRESEIIDRLGRITGANVAEFQRALAELDGDVVKVLKKIVGGYPHALTADPEEKLLDSMVYGVIIGRRLERELAKAPKPSWGGRV